MHVARVCVLVLGLVASCVSDPCDYGNHQVLEDDFRDVGYSCLTNLTTGQCDNLLPEDWYAFKLQGQYATIPTNVCIKPGACGTQLPMRLLLNGSLPGVGEEAAAQGCTAYNILDFWDCCVLRTPVTIKNCGGFFIYKLLPPDRCPVSYCAQVPGASVDSSKTAVQSQPVVEPTCSVATTPVVPTLPPVCLEGLTPCQCYVQRTCTESCHSSRQRCDGKATCPDASDEAGCPASASTLGDHQSTASSDSTTGVVRTLFTDLTTASDNATADDMTSLADVTSTAGAEGTTVVASTGSSATVVTTESATPEPSMGETTLGPSMSPSSSTGSQTSVRTVTDTTTAAAITDSGTGQTSGVTASASTSTSGTSGTSQADVTSFSGSTALLPGQTSATTSRPPSDVTTTRSEAPSSVTSTVASSTGSTAQSSTSPTASSPTVSSSRSSTIPTTLTSSAVTSGHHHTPAPEPTPRLTEYRLQLVFDVQGRTLSIDNFQNELQAAFNLMLAKPDLQPEDWAKVMDYYNSRAYNGTLTPHGILLVTLSAKQGTDQVTASDLKKFLDNVDARAFLEKAMGLPLVAYCVVGEMCSYYRRPQATGVSVFERNLPLFAVLIVLAVIIILVLIFGLLYYRFRYRSGTWVNRDVESKAAVANGDKKEPTSVESPLTDEEIMRGEGNAEKETSLSNEAAMAADSAVVPYPDAEDVTPAEIAPSKMEDTKL